METVNPNNVVLTLKEYQALYIGSMATGTDKALVSKIKELLLESIKHNSYSYGDGDVIDFKSDDKFTKELVTYFKVLDNPFYLAMVTKVLDEHEAAEALKAKEAAEEKKARALKKAAKNEA